MEDDLSRDVLSTRTVMIAVSSDLWVYESKVKCTYVERTVLDELFDNF